MKWFLTFSIFIVGLGAGLLFYANFSYYKKSLGHGEITEIFEVRMGESFTSISQRLEEKKLINRPWFLNILARFYGLRSKVRAGEYLLKDNMSPYEILKTLSEGKSLTHPFMIYEGLNSYEIASQFETYGFGTKEDFLKVCRDQEFLTKTLGEKTPHCEGYLFPETYHFERRTTARQMIETMLRTFNKNYVLVAKGRNLGGWTRHQIITFASIIEKETGAEFERPIIASVFYNRLRKGMRLQTDPTVQYGVLAETGVFPQNITKKDLLRPTPYNTYTRVGFPPGPISNPGVEAIRAVFEPDQTKFLFFVSKNDGTHVFSETYEEHNKAVRAFQLDAKAREGKSWRMLREKTNKPLHPKKR